jgi:hypothetical protein
MTAEFRYVVNQVLSEAKVLTLRASSTTARKYMLVESTSPLSLENNIFVVLVFSSRRSSLIFIVVYLNYMIVKILEI